MKKNLIALLIVIIAIGVVGGGFYYFQAQKAKKQTSAPTVTKEEIKTTDWKNYTNDELGISFSYPAELGVLDFKLYKAGEGKTRLLAGSTWTGSIGTNLTNDRKIDLVSNSTDWKPWARSGYFGDVQTFEEKDGKYYADGSLLEPVKVITRDDLNAVILDHNSIVEARGVSGPTDAVGYLGALINLKNDNFPGLNIELHDTNVSLETFTQFIESFKVFKPIVK